MVCLSLPPETLKWLSSLPILMQESLWWRQCSHKYIISLSPFPPSPSLISLMVSVDVKHHVYLLLSGIELNQGRTLFFFFFFNLRRSCLMFMHVLGYYVASTLLLVPRPFGGHQQHPWDSCVEIMSAPQWHNQFWQSLEEGARKRCMKCASSVQQLMSTLPGYVPV